MNNLLSVSYTPKTIKHEILANAIADLESKLAKANSELEGLESSTKTDPDEIIQPSTPIFKQIFNAHAREQVRFWFRVKKLIYV